MSAAVRIELSCPGRDTVWISYYAVTQADLLGVQRAAGDAVTSFIANLARDEQRNEAVTRWLLGEEVLGQ